MALILKFGLFGAVALAIVLALVGIIIAIAALIGFSDTNHRATTVTALLALAFGMLSMTVAVTTFLAISIFP